MSIKQALQKIYKKLFISENSYQVKFQVLNDKILDRYHHSISYFCREVILDKGNGPKGIYSIFGHDKTSMIIVPYDRSKITTDKIQRFLKSCGIQTKEVENKPFKKLFGISCVTD